MNALLSNPFKRGLLRGETQIGLWLSSTSSYMAEIAATSGYDWLLIDGEHAPNTIQDLYHQLQAIAPYASQPVIRPVEGNRSLINRCWILAPEPCWCRWSIPPSRLGRWSQRPVIPPSGAAALAPAWRERRAGEGWRIIWRRRMTNSVC